MKKILLIEDEQNVAAFVKKSLEEEGYIVSIAFDGKTGLSLLQGSAPDLVILDVLLPDMNGMDVCVSIRKISNTLPILMLTALGTTENKVEGLNSGADDYLVKPFEFEEMLARINALVRRTNLVVDDNESISKYTFKNIQIDDDAKAVTRSGKKINLTATEYKLLLYLMKNAEKVLSREQILNSVWGINFELSTNIVDVYINYLRKKLGNGKKNRIIHTIIGMGYVLKEDE